MIQSQAGDRTWIDQAADRFEAQWKEGADRPRIETFLANEVEPRRAALLEELLRIERALRRNHAETPRPDEYHERFPHDHAAVDAVFGQGAHVEKPGKPRGDAAQCLLFGLLALQNNFIDRETLLAAFNAWVADKSQSLGQILLDRGALSPARHSVLQVLVQEHLQQHGFDPERSLAHVTVVPSVRDDLEELRDFDLQASLLYLRLASTNADEESDAEKTASWEDESTSTDSEGRFRIVRFHDRGALGEVYVARDQQLHRIVALKRIKQDQSIDQDKRARFVVEAEITGRLEHPGIVPVYGLGTYDDGRPFYAMRFIRGDNLKSAIEQFHKAEDKGRTPGERNLALLKLLRRFLDVCNAIDYAHSRGVLHRDLKPGNIMLGKFGETLVVDWGLAKSVGRPEPVPHPATMDDRTLVPQSGSDLHGTEQGARLGTPAYMSPEQAAGRIDELGPASDVYSLGATLYCLLTGDAPVQATGLGELLRKVEHGDFPPPRQSKSWIDPALDAICMKAMANRPDARYRTPRALADDIEHYLADEPVSAWREPLHRRLRRWGRRHRLVVTGLAATLLVAVAALAVGNFLVTRQRDRAEQSLAFARNVVDEMYTGVADKLENEKEMDDYQREILEKALVFYERFALPQSREPQVRLEAARASGRVGKIRSRMGNTPGAEQANRQAVDAIERLVTEHPDEQSYREALAEAHMELAFIFRDQERWPDAEREMKAAATLWDALALMNPAVARYSWQRAEADSNLASCYIEQFRVDEAESRLRQAMTPLEQLVREQPDATNYLKSLERIYVSYAFLRQKVFDPRGQVAFLERAVAINEKLARDNPKESGPQLRLGFTLSSLGVSLGMVKQFHQAEQASKRSIAILEKLAADHPQDVNIAWRLGDSYRSVTNNLLLQGDFRNALAWSSRAIEVFRTLMRRDPLNTRNGRSNLWPTVATRAETLMRLGRYTEALTDFEEVVDLARDSKDQELFRVYEALTKARLGDLSALDRLGNQVRETVKRGSSMGGLQVYNWWMILYDAACVHTALAKLALEDQQKPLSERQRLAAPDIEHALDLLEKARSTGEFKSNVLLDEVRREPLLDPLRTNPRFQLLMMDLEFPDNPFQP
jgi:tetratricopeptide (TPR) repeat protein/tRNA A-37 threonylcarbamoyl transferase component Bud32